MDYSTQVQRCSCLSHSTMRKDKTCKIFTAVNIALVGILCGIYLIEPSFTTLTLTLVTLVSPHPNYCIHACSLYLKQEIQHDERTQILKTGCIIYTFSLERRRLCDDLITVYQIPKRQVDLDQLKAFNLSRHEGFRDTLAQT